MFPRELPDRTGRGGPIHNMVPETSRAKCFVTFKSQGALVFPRLVCPQSKVFTCTNSFFSINAWIKTFGQLIGTCVFVCVQVHTHVCAHVEVRGQPRAVPRDSHCGGWKADGPQGEWALL